MTLTLSSLTASTPISEVKSSIQKHLGGPSVLPDVSKIKILHNKKPIPSSKVTLGDAFVGTETEGQKDVTLSVMVMGGAPDPPPQAATTDTPPAAPAASSGPESEKAAAETATGGLQTDELDAAFWSDLEAFLEQRLKSPGRAKTLAKTFRGASSAT
jgi:hypothetical protein